MPSVSVNESVAVSEGIYPLLGIGVSEFVQLQFRQLIINVNDNVGLSKLITVSDACIITESVAVSVGAVSSASISTFDFVKADDDGQGVALQGGPGAIILVTVIDNVALSKLIIQADALTIAESVAMAIAQPGAGPAINLFDAVAVSETVYVIPDDYVFVTESVSVYFRQLNATVFDAVTMTELTTLLIQGGTGAAVQLSISEDVSISDAATTRMPITPRPFELVFTVEIPSLNVPLAPRPFDAVTVGESVTVLIGKLLMAVNDDVTLIESPDLRFSRLFINIAEGISVVEDNRYGRPSLPWEPAADTEAIWSGSGSTSDDWEPGAVEETVWA